MKTIHVAPPVVLALLALLAGCKAAAPPEAFPQAAADAWLGSFNGGDVAGLVLSYSADAKLLPPDEPTITGAEALVEPFGLVVAEAMACGRPLVVSRAGGAAEIARAGALFHAPGNAGELAECLSQLVRDSGLRASLGAAGRRAALHLFGRQRLSDALVPIYESLA